MILRTRTDYGIPAGRKGAIQRNTGAAGWFAVRPFDLLREFRGIFCANNKL